MNIRRKNYDKKSYGQKWFGGIVDITDPCYDKSIWCRMDAKVKSGDYDCVTWTGKEIGYHYNGAEYTYDVIRIIGIYLDGEVPSRRKMEYIGEIGVDAGLAGFFINKPDYNRDEWLNFCSECENDGDGDAWLWDIGFFSCSGDGDGAYPVYAAKNRDGEIIALEIRF